MNDFVNILNKEKKRFRCWTFVIVLFLLIFSFLELSLGSAGIGVNELLSFNTDFVQFILLEIRIPRLLTALLIGATLSFSGLILQTVFRNPLVGPSVLGITSGASLGVALVTMSGITVFLGDFSKVASALVFSFFILLLLFSTASRFKDNASVLIIGMLISYLAGAIVDILTFVSKNDELKEFTLWGMGSFSRMTYGELLLVFVLLLLSFVFTYGKRSLLNRYIIGELDEVDETTKKRLRFSLLAIAGVLTAFVTAYCGPIAFLGIAIPNLFRFILRVSNHRYLLPGTILLGALLAVVCDLLSAMPWSNQSLPVNAVTSLFGIPIIILMIVKSKRQKL